MSTASPTPIRSPQPAAHESLARGAQGGRAPHDGAPAGRFASLLAGLEGLGAWWADAGAGTASTAAEATAATDEVQADAAAADGLQWAALLGAPMPAPVPPADTSFALARGAGHAAGDGDRAIVLDGLTALGPVGAAAAAQARADASGGVGAAAGADAASRPALAAASAGATADAGGALTAAESNAPLPEAGALPAAAGVMPGAVPAAARPHAGGAARGGIGGPGVAADRLAMDVVAEAAAREADAGSTSPSGDAFVAPMRPAEAGGAWPLAQAAGPDATPVRSPAAGVAAAAAPIELSLSTPVGHEDFGLTLGLQVGALVREGVHEAKVQLNPAELGPITIEIALDGRAAEVHFVATHEHAREALRDSLGTLERALQADGFTLAGGTVGDSRSSGRGDAGRDAPQGRRMAVEVAVLAADAANHGSATRAAARGALDVYA